MTLNQFVQSVSIYVISTSVVATITSATTRCPKTFFYSNKEYSSVESGELIG